MEIQIIENETVRGQIIVFIFSFRELFVLSSNEIFGSWW